MRALEMLNTFIKNGNNKKYILATAVLISLFFLERFFHEKIRVKLEKIVFLEIEKIHPTNKISYIDYFYFPPKLIFKEAELKDPKEQASFIAQTGYISLKLFPLIGGRVKLKELSIRDASINVNIDSNKSSQQKEIDISLKLLLKTIPLSFVSIKNTIVTIQDSKNKYKFNFSKAHLTKSNDKLWLDIKSKNTINLNKQIINIGLDADLNWGQKGIFITSFNLLKNSSKISLTGLFHEDIINSLANRRSPFNKVHELRSSSQLELSDFTDLYKSLPPSEQVKYKFLKNASGKIKIKGNLLAENDLEAKREGRIKVAVSSLKTKFTNINQFNFSAKIHDSKLESDDLELAFSKNSKINLDKISVQKVKQDYNLSFNVKSNYLELRDILKNINVNAKNIKIPFSIFGKCSGRLGNTSNLLKCQNTGKLISGLVKSPSGKGAIVDINSANYKLESFITDKDIKLQVEADGSDSNATASGVIDFKQGFNFNVEAPRLSYTSFLNEIASSKITGTGFLNGNIKGNSRTASFDLKAKVAGSEFNEIFIGAATFGISYQYPNVDIKKVNGFINDSKYQGDINFNVDKEKLNIFLFSNNIDSNTVTQAFKKKFSFPADVSFNGDFKVNASGPPNIDKMDLEFISNLSGIKAFTEKFSDGKLNLKGLNGNWKITEAFLIDQKKSVKVNGSLNGLKTLDIELTSSQYNAADISLLKDLGLNIFGPLDFSLKAVGPLEGPKATGHVFASKLKGSFRKMGNLDLNYRLFQDGFNWSGNLFSKSILGKGYLPFDSNQPFSFDGTLSNFDIVNILSVAKDSVKKPKSSLSGDFKSLKTKNLKTGTLKGDVSDFSLSFSSSGVKPFLVKQINPSNDLRRKIKLKLLQNNISNCSLSLYFKNLDNLSFSKIGLLDLDFIEPFIPGTEQLNAILESDFEIKNVNGVTNGSGASYLKGLAYRNASFPYTFTSGKSKIAWHSTHAAFSDTTAVLNGSKVEGSGKVSYNPNFFLDFVFKYKSLRLELPDNINSTSDGTLYISGSRLPLQLTGAVNVLNGVFAIDLLASDSSTSIQPSHLLPNVVLKEDSSPFRLNLDINLINPFEINSPQVKGFASGGLNVHGLISNPRLSGRVELEKGTKLLFQEKQFIVNEGNIYYKNKPPNNPTFFIDSEAKLTDKNSIVSTEYDVRVILKGSGQNPEPEFTSQPSLDKKQIISLIAIGTTSTQTLDQEIGEEQQATQTGLQAGSYLLQKNKAIQDFQAQTGTEIEISSSVDSGGVNPKVGINKSWTPKFSSNLSQTFGNQKQISLDNKYKINKNLSTVIKLQNSRTDDASLIINRRVPDGNILGLDLEYNVEFK